MIAKKEPAIVSRFEFFVALRYLRAKRKQAVISVITAISIAGVAAGVMALVIALAINNGFRSTLQKNLLGATSHVNVLEKEPMFGIEEWRDLVARFRSLPGVVGAAPTLYGQVLVTGPLHSKGALIKGIDPSAPATLPDALRHLKEGSLDGLADEDGTPGVILGSRLAQETGMPFGSRVTLLAPQGEITPLGPVPNRQLFRVVGIFESGFYDIDANWAYASLGATQRLLGLADVVNAIEITVGDIYRAPEVAAAAEKAAGPELAATHWQEQNRQLLSALKMEKTVTMITISLIVLVAALNILIALVMMVMEKYRDIAVLISMGAGRRQIRNIFLCQGLLIGVVGTATGLTIGHALCFLAARYRWLRLDESVYALSYVPFEPHWIDAVWIAGMALAVSFLATLYPARSATRIAPAEVLRYE
ncbi:MAG: ABC transporter permease [Bryobacterales bacterium]|nr:ABC transporter permease [Bryobacterales bacterium]